MNRRIISFFLLALVGVIGCNPQGAEDGAAIEGLPKSGLVAKEQQVEKRAKSRWEALIAQDVDKAYQYLTPGFRQVNTLDTYKASRRAGGVALWKSADVESVKCEESICTVKLKLTYIYMGSVGALQGQELSTTLTEKWILSDGDWWFLSE